MVSWSSLNDMQSDQREFEKLGMVMELVMREERLVQKKSFPFALPDIVISGEPWTSCGSLLELQD